jgi:hypothetical protein
LRFSETNIVVCVVCCVACAVGVYHQCFVARRSLVCAQMNKGMLLVCAQYCGRGSMVVVEDGPSSSQGCARKSDDVVCLLAL